MNGKNKNNNKGGSKKDSTNNIDADKLLAEFEAACKKLLEEFLHKIADSAPNVIDMKKFMSCKIGRNEKKTLNDYRSEGEVMITPIGNKSVQIEATDVSKSSSIYQPIYRSFMEEGYQVNEAAGILTISLKQVTEESRLKIVKEMVELKERYKRDINDFRTKTNQKLKGLPEDQLATEVENVEEIKKKYQKQLETEYEKKHDEIMPGAGKKKK